MHFVDISDAKTNLVFNCFISMAFKQRDSITMRGADKTQSAEQIAKRSIIEAQEENLSHYEHKMSNLMPDQILIIVCVCKTQDSIQNQFYTILSINEYMENHPSQGKMIATPMCSGEYVAFLLQPFLLSNAGNKTGSFLLVTYISIF